MAKIQLPPEKLALQAAMLAYEQRFKQPVPGTALRELTTEQLKQRIQAALAAGQSVPEWASAPESDLLTT